MNHSDRIWQLMARVLNQEASAIEHEELQTLLHADESLQQQFDLLSRIWQERESGADDESEARATVQKIIHKAEEETDLIVLYDAAIRRRRIRAWRIAATVLILLSAGLGYLFINPRDDSGTMARNNSLKESLVAQKGSRTRSMLPDGSTVWLNAGSRLHYINDFNGETREVSLEGEAYFDIAKKENQPFIVHTGGIRIRVLGTAFNVKSYPEDKNVETTLFHGRVQVDRMVEVNDSPEREIIDLRPNQKLILPKQAAMEGQELSKEIQPAQILSQADFIIAPIDSTKKEEERFETAWLFSRLEFRGDNFEQLAYKLERWYDVEVRFTDENVKKLNFNGSFEKESIAEAFAALQTALPYFTYKIENNVITVGAPR